MDRYIQRFTVTANDMNNQYRLTPHAVLLYFQDCFARYMSCLHLAAFDLVKQHQMWIITEFRAEMNPVDVFWTHDLEVTLWVSEIYDSIPNSIFVKSLIGRQWRRVWAAGVCSTPKPIVWCR